MEKITLELARGIYLEHGVDWLSDKAITQDILSITASNFDEACSALHQMAREEFGERLSDEFQATHFRNERYDY